MPSKHTIFDRARAALAAVSNPPLVGYVCPICLQLHATAVDLTEEHVPPRSLGGKVLCLTCRNCNSSAGHSIDSAIHYERRMARFLSPDGHRTRVKLTLDGISLNVEMFTEPEAINIRVLPGQNNPKAEAQFQSKLRGKDTVGATLKATIWGGYRQREADVGYLKSAYLAAFAKFGYTWVFNADTDPIRRQIRDPRSEVLKRFRVGFSDGDGSPGDGFYRMVQPISAMMVRMGIVGIFLPWIQGIKATDIADWIELEKATAPTANHTYIEFSPWPDDMELLMDRRARDDFQL